MKKHKKYILLFFVILLSSIVLAGCNTQVSKQPEATPTTRPEATPTDEPEATPTDKTGRATPTMKPEATPIEKPEVIPTERSEATPTERPEVTPIEKPEVIPTDKPEATPTDKPEASGDESGQKVFRWSAYTGQVTELTDAKIGDVVSFGKHNMDDSMYNGKEPLYWKVIDKWNDYIFLTCEYYIECTDIPLLYDGNGKFITWESSPLRDWLNKRFLWNSFHIDDEVPKVLNVKMDHKTNPLIPADKPENETITDRIFLLSYDEKDGAFVRPAIWVRVDGYSFDQKIGENYHLSLCGKDGIHQLTGEEELLLVKKRAEMKMDEAYSSCHPKNYSDENVALLQSIYQTALSEIDLALTVEEVEKTTTQAINQLNDVTEIPNIRDISNEKVADAYQKSLEKASSLKNWGKIQVIYKDYTKERAYISGEDSFLEFTQKTIQELQAFPTTAEARKEEARSQWKQDCQGTDKKIQELYQIYDKKIAEADSVSDINEILLNGQIELSVTLGELYGLPQGYLNSEALQRKISDLKLKYPYYPIEDITILVVGANLDYIRLHTVYQVLNIKTENEYREKAERYLDILMDKETAAARLLSLTNGYGEELYLEQKLDYTEYIRTDELFFDEKLVKQAKAIEDANLDLLQNSKYEENAGTYATMAMHSYISKIYPKIQEKVEHFPYQWDELAIGPAAEYLLKDWVVYMSASTNWELPAEYGDIVTAGKNGRIGKRLILENPFYEVDMVNHTYPIKTE